MRSVRGIIRATIAVVVGSAALASSASAAVCPDLPSTKAFAAWGDTADYERLPGGDFGPGPFFTKLIPNGLVDATYGWQLLNGAMPVRDQDPFNVGGRTASGDWAVELRPGAQLVSPAFCVDEARPYYRFMLRQTPDAVPSPYANGPVSRPSVGAQPEYLAPDGTWKSVAGNPQGDRTAWGPSNKAFLLATLPAGSAKQGVWQIRLRFVSLVSAGAVRVDNVMVDPYRRR